MAKIWLAKRDIRTLSRWSIKESSWRSGKIKTPSFAIENYLPASFSRISSMSPRKHDATMYEAVASVVGDGFAS